jgi:rhodanese-related sulfurtransferase
MKVITAQELKAKMDAGEQLNLLDVREPHEHAEFNIGGTLYPLGRIQSMQVEDLEELKNQELICYCRSGQRSMVACMTLEMLGFKNVINLAGGMLGWQQNYGSK